MILADSTATDVMIAGIAAIPATIIALATYAKVHAARGAVEDLTAANTEQHVGTNDKLDGIVATQAWLVQQIGATRQALLDHVLWEEGAHVHIDGMSGGKYADLERQLREVQAHLAQQDGTH